MKRLWATLAASLFALAPCTAAEPASTAAELRAAFAGNTDENDSTNPLMRMWSLLELIPAAGQVTSVYVPQAHTESTPGGPSRIVLLPAPAYAQPMLELLRRQLSERRGDNTAPAGSCSGDAAAFTDCCTPSPTLSCVEDARTLAPETTFAALRGPLYAATAMDLVALELVPRLISHPVKDLKQRVLLSNTLYLLLGDDNKLVGNVLLLRMDAPVLGKLALLVKRLELQISLRKGQSSRLQGHLACDAGRWRALSQGGAASNWLAGSQPVTLRGTDKPPYLWLGMARDGAALRIISRESFSPGTPGTLYDFYNGAEGSAALAVCLGPQVGVELNQAKPLLNILKSPEVTTFVAAWMQLAGSLAVLSENP